MNVLLVSIAFPPKRDPESLQVAKYCKYLTSHKDVSLEAITSSDPTLYMEIDDNLMSYRVGINVRRELTILENRYINFFIRKIDPTLLLYPDSKFSFWWQLKSAIASIDAKPDIIYSRSYPVSSTLLALGLKKQLNVPWVLHLSDPWAIASERSNSPATRITGTARKWNQKKEKECFELADKISFTSKKTIALYERAYPGLSHKFVYYPNVYDDSLIQPNVYRRGNELKFVYNGGFGEARSPLTYLKAIKLFWQKHSYALQGHVKFLFTGEMTRANTQIFEDFKDVPIIKHLGVIPYNEVVSLQRQADILVNIDSNIADAIHAVFFPSKLLDYIIAQRRILAITNSYSTTYDVVQGNLGDCFDFDDVEGLASYLDLVYKKYTENDTSYFYQPEISKEFSAQHNANRLRQLFSDLTSKPIFQ